MNQINMFLELIKYFLTIKEVDSKDILRKKYCGFNDTYKKYFGITWNTLEQLDILVDNKLNPNYINAYNLKDNDIDFIIDSTINIIKQYSVKNNDCDKDLKSFRSDIKNENEMKYLQELEKDFIYYPMQMKNSIINIFDRVINPKNEYTPNKIYKTIKNPLLYNKHKNTHYVFKIVLMLLLEKDDELKSDEILTITDEEILDIADNYVNREYASYEKTKINMKNDVINALKLSKIIEENETNPYKVNPFIDKEWKLDATTKTTAIEKVIKKIVNLKSLSSEQIKLINEIFQYSSR
jgi:hypothetical protein